MTDQTNPPVRVLRSLPLTILFGIAVSVIGAVIMKYYIGLRFADVPLPAVALRLRVPRQQRLTTG
jgi:hypothetical protein